jgi:tetratricopeptide (TPR) repeat protein
MPLPSRMVWLAPLLLGLGSVSLLSETARAEAGVSRAESPEVEKLLAQGIALRAAGNDLEASQVLKKAAAIDPESVRVQVHLATVYQALGEWLLADDYLGLALSHEAHPYVVRHRKSLDDAQRVISANIGRLEVEGEPAGAEVRLNGRLIGTLPLAAPARATVGSYSLEVRLEGHYTLQRPLVITGNSLSRESVRLEPRPADEPHAALASTGQGGDPTADRPAERPWLTWTLGGLSAAAGVTTITALVYREVHANNWNDNSQCLSADQTREELCGAERDKAESAGSVAVVAGVATGLFAAGALLNAFAFSTEAPSGQASLQGCTVGLMGASCFGSF